VADPPAVTLLLLAYNQEAFAAEAARSALGQDYPNLQLVLSDDCSGDGTLATLQGEATGYRGSHRVVVRRTERNLGLIAHLYDAVSVATGELVVVAAGDDLSYPHRVRRLVERWQETGANALHSNWDVIDETGRTIRRGRPEGRSDLRLDVIFAGRQPQQLIGATAAYSRNLFEIIPCPSERIFAEDLYFSLILNGFGRTIAYVDEPLIGYREHGGAVTHAGRSRSVADHERSTERESGRVADVLRAFQRGARDGGPWGEPQVDWAAVEQDIAFNRFRSSWTCAGTVERLRALARFSAPSQRRWLLPRVLGLGPFVAAKTLLNRAG
jgi:hypothetical protein